MRGSEKRAYAGLCLGVFAISWSALLARWSGLPGPVSAFWRVAIAGLILLVWSLLTRPIPLNRHQFFLAGCGGVFFAADLAFFNTAANRAGATDVTALGNNAPLFAGLLSWLIWGRRPTARLWLALACAAAGTAVLAGGELLRSTRSGVADLMALGASLCFAVYLLVTERLRSETGTLSFLTAALASTALSLLAFNVVCGYSLAVHTQTSWAAVIGLALIPQLTGYLAITYALGHLSATTVSITLTAQVPTTAILAAFLLGERLLAHELWGSLMILAAIWITLIRRPRLRRAIPL